jgi:HD-like signal output (HDOD) protein
VNVVQFSVEPLLRVAQAFPATPRIMAELGRLLRDPNANLKDVTVLLKSDSALAARLLRVANSAALGQPERVDSIDDAAALIGFREIHRLVGAVAIDQFSLANYPLYGIAGPRLRENALLVALLMEELAATTEHNPSAAYTCGLFRSLGKLVLEKLAAEGKPATPFDAARDADLLTWERHTFGIAACDATAAILQHWQFPADIAKGIARQFAPAGSRQPLAYLLNVAMSLADQLGRGLPGEQRYAFEAAETYDQTGFDPRHRQRCVDRAVAAYDQLSRALS